MLRSVAVAVGIASVMACGAQAGSGSLPVPHAPHAPRTIAFDGPPGAVDDGPIGGGRCDGSDESFAIDDAIRRDADQASTWNLTWGIVFAAAAVGQAGVAAGAGDRISDDKKTALWLSAGKAGIGALSRLIVPLHIEPVPDCADAATQRAALAKAARKERNSLILNVVGGLALNTAGLLYLGFERDAWKDGLMSFAIGTAVGALSSYTAPRRSWRMHRRMEGATVRLAPLLGDGKSGLAVVGSW